MIISCVSLLAFYTININYYKFYNDSENIYCEVKVVEKYDTYSIVSDGEGKYLIYNNDYVFYSGSKIYLKGTLKCIKETYNSFYTYLNKKGVNYEIKYYKLYVLENNQKLNEHIVEGLLAKKGEVSKSYLKLILFNVKDDVNDDFYETFTVYSLTHLIAVSGFQISILLIFFKKIFKNSVIGYLAVSFYLYLLDFSVSSYRAFLCHIFKKINKKCGFSLSNNDVISLVGIVFIVINPSVMFSYSFIYSFLATLVLEIFKIYTKKNFMITFYIYLVNVPLMLISSYKLNVSTILFSFVLNIPITFLYVFSFVFLFLDKFYLLYEFFMSLLLSMFGYLDKLNLVLVMGKPSIIFVIFYYIMLFMFFVLKERKNKVRGMYLLIVILLLFYQYCKPLFNNNEQIFFLNVGQGDCSVFVIPNSKKAVLVDTGGSKYSDVAIKKIIPFLESQGINEIDKVIITHDDFDHNGALNSLRENFKINELVLSSNFENIQIGKKVFLNLNISENRDNDGSVVLLGEYAGYSLILMGDVSSLVELDIVEDVGKIDIIKVGHHGSKSSSSFEFLDKIDGKIAIISVGLNNIYGHPDEEVLQRLKDLGYFILRTDENNHIGFGKDLWNVNFIDYFKNK